MMRFCYLIMYVLSELFFLDNLLYIIFFVVVDCLLTLFSYFFIHICVCVLEKQTGQ